MIETRTPLELQQAYKAEVRWLRRILLSQPLEQLPATAFGIGEIVNRALITLRAAELAAGKAKR